MVALRFAFASAVAVAGLAACAPPHAAAPYPATPPPAGTAPAPQADPEPPAEDPDTGVATYFDRRVDLAPFLAGFPYTRFKPSLRTGKLFFFAKGDTYTLEMLDVSDGGPAALSKATPISDVDWSKRSLWSIQHHEPTHTLWMLADAKNDEQMNLWTLALDTQELEQVTQHDYVYGFGLNEDRTQIAYLPRKGKKAPFSTCLRVRSIADGSEREIVCDTPQLPFTWASPRFTPDGKSIYFKAQIEGDRNRVQIVVVNLDDPEPKVRVVTNRRKSRNSPDLLEGWLGDELLYTANDDGFRNLYALHAKSGKTRQITEFKEDVSSAKLTAGRVVGVHQTPAGATLFVVDPETGALQSERKLPGSAEVRDAHGGRAWVTHTAPDIVFQAFDVVLGDKGFAKVDESVGVDPALEEQIVTCKATLVKIPTFDKDPKTKKKRELHAFVLEPVTPLEHPEQRLAMITAFYGGGSAYSRYDNIMCAAGITIVSPAVRGSSGFGKAFYSLNDKDLGGDEIVDLFYVAKWIEERYGLPARRIGVYGGSHGGYATMRALTYPPQTNGRNEFYPLGFGMAHAGFSDIKTFYDATNIPDWVVLESGDPNVAKELARMTDRSPMAHVDRLVSPLMLTHGSEDWRVPVDESRQFAEAAKTRGRPVSYVEIDGQGHHIEGLALQAQVFQARFNFLKVVAEAAPAPE